MQARGRCTVLGWFIPPLPYHEGGSGRTRAVKGRVIYSKSRFATTNLRLTELPDSWGRPRVGHATDRCRAAVFAIAAGDVAELQGRFVIVPRCLIRGSIDRAERVGTPVHGRAQTTRGSERAKATSEGTSLDRSLTCNYPIASR